MKHQTLLTPEPNSRAVAYEKGHNNNINNELLSIQAKLTVGEPDDQYEQEADNVADTVMSMSEPQVSRTAGEDEEKLQTKPLSARITPLIQRQPEEEEPLQTKLIQRESQEDEEETVQPKLIQRQQPEEDEEKPLQARFIQKQPEEEEEPVQTKLISRKEEKSTATDASWLDDQLQGTKGSGNPLPDDTRASMENRFGNDFSNVRVHTGVNAVQMNKELRAQAFTHGNDIYFNSGKYNPEHSSGKHLLAHELTHTVQQNYSDNCLLKPKTRYKNFTITLNRSARSIASYTLPFINRVNDMKVQRACQYFPAHSSPDTYCETRTEAEALITRACPPFRNCFLYRDGPPGFQWRRIPGFGCAHYVAHRLGITEGPSYANCQDGFSVTIDQITQGRNVHPLANALAGDIWSSGFHSGVVTQVDSTVPRVRVDQCGTGGNTQAVWFGYGDVYR